MSTRFRPLPSTEPRPDTTPVRISVRRAVAYRRSKGGVVKRLTTEDVTVHLDVVDAIPVELEGAPGFGLVDCGTEFGVVRPPDRETWTVESRLGEYTVKDRWGHHEHPDLPPRPGGGSYAELRDDPFLGVRSRALRNPILYDRLDEAEAHLREVEHRFATTADGTLVERVGFPVVARKESGGTELRWTLPMAPGRPSSPWDLHEWMGRRMDKALDRPRPGDEGLAYDSFRRRRPLGDGSPILDVPGMPSAAATLGVYGLRAALTENAGSMIDADPDTLVAWRVATDALIDGRPPSAEGLAALRALRDAPWGTLPGDPFVANTLTPDISATRDDIVGWIDRVDAFVASGDLTPTDDPDAPRSLMEAAFLERRSPAPLPVPRGP